MQLDVTDFQRKPKEIEVEQVKLADLPQKPDTLPVLADECRVREGDILKPLPSAPISRVPTALRGIALSRISSRSELVCALTHNLPRNDYNMPKLIYRPDLLDPSIFHTSDPTPSAVPDLPIPHAIAEDTNKFQAMQDLLDASTIILNYYEGFPALSNGKPIWDKFDWESPTDFSHFKQYLALPGARTASLLSPDAQLCFSELFHVNYWAIRCLASDTFAVIHYQRMREQRILKTDDKHFLESEALLTTLLALKNEVEWDALKEDPKQYVEVLERLTKIQRAALGHSAQGGGEHEHSVQSIEVLLRKIAPQAVPTAENKAEGLDITQLLTDPASLERAQELILRVNTK